MKGETGAGDVTSADGAARGWPLRRYLAVLVALFVLTAGSGAWYTWVQSERDALATALDDAEFGAQQAARQIGEAVDQVRTSVSQLAANPSINQVFTAPKGCQLAFSLFGSADDTGHLDVVANAGTVACSSRPPTGATDGYAGESWLGRAVREPATAGPLTDRRTGRQALIISVPVAGRGAVAALIDLSALGRGAGDLLGGPRHLVFLVLDGKLDGKRHGDVNGKGATVLTRSAGAARWIGKPVSATRFANPAGTGSDVDVDGVRRVFGQATVPGLRWQVNAGADRATALASAHRLVRRQALILGAGLIAGLVATWLVYRRITRPIARLSTAVRAASAGGEPGAIAAGGPREVATLGTDFAELVAAVRRELNERRQAERNYRQLFGSNPHPMYVLDTSTLALLEVNEATASYYGYSREELLRLDATSLSLPEDAAALAEAVGTASGVEQWASMRQVKRDGSVVTVNVTSHPLSFRGRPARCAAIEDVTEKEQLERRLRQSQRLESLGQLAGGVAHDFNNLLGVMMGYATMCAQDVEVIAMTDPAWQRVHADLGQILQAGDRAANVTRQLLAFARHDVPQTQVIDLNDVVSGVEQLLRRSIGEDIDLRTDLAADPWPIKADPGQIDQVLLNLAVNARDAMPSGGTLTIDTAPVTIDEHYAAHHPGTSTGPHMRLRVSDSGTGMSQETIDRAFEPFFTTKPKGQGTGLGLATIYGIVTQAGGHAQIYSEPGVGTTFTAVFPATRELATDGPQAPDPDYSDYRAQDGETILLVEDEDSLRLLTERILARHGYAVICASDGAEALAVATERNSRIDLLLTDVIMPHMSGHELATRLHETRPALPVIYMSGYAEPLLASRSTLPAGVTLLSKPATEQQILAAIHRALGSGPRPPAHTARQASHSSPHLS